MSASRPAPHILRQPSATASSGGGQTTALVHRVCREFTRATGWPLRFVADDGAMPSPPTHPKQKTAWRIDLRDGAQRSGWLRIDQPQRQTQDEEFLRACELADAVAQVFSRVLADPDTAEGLLVPQAIGKAEPLPQTLKKVLENLLKLTGLRSAGFFLLSPGGDELRMRVETNRDGQIIPAQSRRLKDSPFDQLAIHSGVQLLRRGEGDAELVAAMMPESCKLGLCQPVRTSTDPIGTLWAFDRRARRLAEREMDIVESVAGRIGHLLEHAVLRQESADKQRMSGEMAAAAANTCDEFSVHTVGEIDVATRTASHTELGGDMCEVLADGEQAVIGLGDASGHSLPATMVMATVRGALRALAQDTTMRIDSDEIMSRLNRSLIGVAQSHQFMTMVCGHLDASNRGREGGCAGRLTFTNAGHPHPVLLRGGNVELPDSHGILLGIMPNAEYERSTVELQPGDVLALYTDGLAEAQGDGNRMFKTEGVAASVERNARKSAEEIRDALWADVERHLDGRECDDDRTVMVLKAN